ncbi:hypothetical protein HFP72_07060 [Nocardiopsis sp. ARC36]
MAAPPDPESWERLVARADELGLVDRESAEELREERRDAAARLREGSPGRRRRPTNWR